MITNMLSEKFVKDVMHYAQCDKLLGFNLMKCYDEEIDVFFFMHNDPNIETNQQFYAYIVKKMDEYFFSNSITNVCFYYDYEFAKSCQNELKGLLDTLFSESQEVRGNIVKVILPKKEENKIIGTKVRSFNLTDFRLEKEDGVYRKITTGVAA